MKQWFSDGSLLYEISKDSFGNYVDLAELKRGFQEYNHLELIDKLEAAVQKDIEVNKANSVEKCKLDYYDLGLGVFSFDRAAKGMYQLIEFYSPSMKRAFERSEVIEENGKLSLKADNSEIISRLEQKRKWLNQGAFLQQDGFYLLP